MGDSLGEIKRNQFCDYNFINSPVILSPHFTPCHLVLSTRRVLATVLTILLQCFLSAVTSLSSASFIPVTSCISSIHFLLGGPLLLLPSPCASIILFSSPSDRITCPKNPSFLLRAVCCSVSGFPYVIVYFCYDLYRHIFPCFYQFYGYPVLTRCFVVF